MNKQAKTPATNTKTPSFQKRAFEFGRKFINYKVGIMGALVLGGMVFFINVDHGILPGLTAGLKQGFYTFFIGGAITKLAEESSTWIKPRVLAIIGSILFTTFLAVLLVYLLHSMKGTPKPFESTLPTLFLSPPGFFLVALQRRYNIKILSKAIGS